MQQLILAIFTVFSLSALAATNLNSTDINIKTAPSVAQLETARALLSEAVEARQAGSAKLFAEKLALAKKYQEYRLVKKNFKAAFVTAYDTTKINYFSNDEIRYEVNIENTCYNGDVSEAIALLQSAIDASMMGSDELWYENPRQNKKTISLDLVDGPNDLKDQVSVSPCR